MIYMSENVLEIFRLQPTKNPSTLKQTMWTEKNHSLLSCQKKKPLDMLQVRIPLWRAHLSPHVSHVQQHTWSWLRHRQRASPCVFSGHSGGISVKRFTILKCVSELRASTVRRPPSTAVVFGFPGSSWQPSAKGRLQTGSISCSSSKPPSVCRGGRRRIPTKPVCMVKHRGAPTGRYSLYMFAQGQIEIIWASPEGERECAVWSELGCNKRSFDGHDRSTLLSHSNQEPWAPSRVSLAPLLLSCAICRSEPLKTLKDLVIFLSFSIRMMLSSRRRGTLST